MHKEDIKKYLKMLGQELQKKEVTGEVLIADGIVMLLDVGKPEEPDIKAYLAYLRGEGPAIERRRDINAYFSGHGAAIREAIATIAHREGLPDSWLNDALQELFSRQPPHQKWLEYPGLRVYLAPLDYVLAMKVAAGSPEDAQ